MKVISLKNKHHSSFKILQLSDFQKYNYISNIYLSIVEGYFITHGLECQYYSHYIGWLASVTLILHQIKPTENIYTSSILLNTHKGLFTNDVMSQRVGGLAKK